MSNRDEFSPKTKRVIAERAAYVCSNPDHRVFTIKPHSDPEKSLSSGVAAHIKGAAQNGPRYDPTQTKAERVHPSNGIWLCHSCSDLIDKDERRYTGTVLNEWRAEHERWISGEGLLARLPEISLSTIHGLSVPETGGTVTAAEIDFFREHHLSIKNVGHHRLDGFSGRLQLPERTMIGQVVKAAGAVVEIRPDRMALVASATGSGAVTMPNVKDLPFPNFILSISSILPGEEVKITLVSGPNDPGDYPSVPPHLFGRDALHFYLAGSFVYERNTAFLKRAFLVPIDFDPVSRRLSSQPCEEDGGTRNVLLTQVSW